MKKEYLITEIAIAPDGSPHVFVSMVEGKDFQKGQQPSYPPSGGRFTVLGPVSSPENISKDIQKALSGMFGGGAGGGGLGLQATVIKLDIREYQESGLKVGDKVAVEITRETTKEEV
jgi:hypothetical protein